MQRSAPWAFLVCVLLAAACGRAAEPELRSSDAATTRDTTLTIPIATAPTSAESVTIGPPVTELVDVDPTTLATVPPTTDGPALGPGEAYDGTAVVYGGSGRSGEPWVPLGWWDGAGWMRAGYAAEGSLIRPPAPDLQTVAATSLDLPDGPGAVVGGLSLGTDLLYCAGDETGPVIDLPIEIPATPVSLGANVIAVTADWPLQPRPVTQRGLEAGEYADIGARLLEGEVARASEGKVAQVVRADLDGDGLEEVLVTYERITDTHVGAVDDFSAIYVRYPSADGSVVDALLWSYVLDAPIDYPTIGRATIAAVADLNGDGRMEVALREMFWESIRNTVWELRDGRLVEILAGGCGV